MTGIIISCKIIPGIAVNNAPEIKAYNVKGVLVNESNIISNQNDRISTAD